MSKKDFRSIRNHKIFNEKSKNEKKKRSPLTLGLFGDKMFSKKKGIENN